MSLQRRGRLLLGMGLIVAAGAGLAQAGPQITCQLDGQILLEAKDPTFPAADMIGLWSKAAAQSYSDDLTVIPQ